MDEGPLISFCCWHGKVVRKGGFKAVRVSLLSVLHVVCMGVEFC